MSRTCIVLSCSSSKSSFHWFHWRLRVWEQTSRAVLAYIWRHLQRPWTDWRTLKVFLVWSVFRRPPLEMGFSGSLWEILMMFGMNQHLLPCVIHNINYFFKMYRKINNNTHCCSHPQHWKSFSGSILVGKDELAGFLPSSQTSQNRSRWSSSGQPFKCVQNLKL